MGKIGREKKKRVVEEEGQERKKLIIIEYLPYFFSCYYIYSQETNHIGILLPCYK
jgi:hypothetical protein